MASTRTSTRPYLPALRQWGRVTVTSVLKHKRKPTVFVSALTAWIIILVLLYALRLFAKQSGTSISPSSYTSDKSYSDPSFWTQRHLIFCISPGLAGSAHLAHVLDFAHNARVFHQPHPFMAGEILQAVLLNGQRDSTFESRAAQKLGSIQLELKHAPKQAVYAETSHMFIKTYADVVLQTLGDISNISIIALRQPIQNTVYSQLINGWFSSHHDRNREGYYDIKDVHPSERVVPTNFSMSDIADRAIAYNTDIWIRAQRLRQQVELRQKRGQWTNVRFIDLRLDSIMSSGDVQSFLSSLGLSSNYNQPDLLSFHLDDDDDNESKPGDVSVDAHHHENTIDTQGRETTPEKVLQRVEELRTKYSVLEDINAFLG